jgi:tetratricopeptide (TPR) repeat protein
MKTRQAERLYSEGQFLLSKGKGDVAVRKFEKSMKLAKEAGFQAGVAHNLNELAIFYTAQGELEKARDYLQESYTIYMEEGMAPEVSKSLNNIASTYMREGKVLKAVEQYEKLLEWDRQSDNRLGEGITLYNMGLLYQGHLKQPGKALSHYRQALEIFQALGKEEYIRILEEKLDSYE